MDNSEVYLILLRPSRVPVAGEAVAECFQGQVELQSWTWNLHNEDERKSAQADAQQFSRQQDLIGRQIGDVGRQLNGITDAERSGSVQEVESDLRANQVAELERNRNFEFSFSKRIDVATTQMLNSMKAGDIFPSGTLTIHQRSSNSGLSLVINLQKVRLLDYALKVEATDTMTDMLEQWTAEFGALSYVYKNRAAVASASGAGQAAAQAASQGTVRAFAMKTIGSPV